MPKDKTPPYLERLRDECPRLAITLHREHDPFYRWDGDGPNPRKSGFKPYDVCVTAQAIMGGVLYEGTNWLGGSYYRDNEPLGDVHGYLPQMIDEAVDDLRKIIPPGDSFALTDCDTAQEIMRQVMRELYDRQMKQHHVE